MPFYSLLIATNKPTLRKSDKCIFFINKLRYKNQQQTKPPEPQTFKRGRRGREVVGFITTYAISAYHH